jgi:Uncharacterized conserved protein (COG2071)
VNVRTVVRDCLLLHWALPREALPPPPPPLRYEEHSLEGCGSRVLVTVLLSLHQGVQVADLPILRLTYPQFNLALPVLGEDCVPGLLFEKVLVPAWVLPAARLVARQPVSTARLSFARPSEQLDEERWQWSVEKDGDFAVEARQASPADGPPMGSWRTFTDSLRQRRRGYYRNTKGVRSFETRVLTGEAWPLAVEVLEAGLLERAFPLVDPSCWRELSSAVLFPELPLETELSLAPQVTLSRQVPQPAASRRSAVCG